MSRRVTDAELDAPRPAAPTQSLGIREAKAAADPVDPTRTVHPDSVPLEGEPHPSRNDQINPTSDPRGPDIE